MNQPEITFENLKNPRSYEAFKALVEELVAQESTSGPEQTAEKVGFTKLNLQRMKRVEKQFSLLPELQEWLQKIEAEWRWLVLAEAWCGDGAQVIPGLAAIAAATPAISLEVVLRDENPELMDKFMTDAKRAIPILVCYDKATGEHLFTWGPRPKEIQEKTVAFKAENPAATKEEFHQQLHLWYAKDRSLALQHDLLNLVKAAVEKTSVSI